ncbi:MAG: hypothetical protein LBJ36_01485 [Synergistaceae bacterium]|jgi:hypothetical protein|nr:hypothetical protein [Synergistaceae bacterium]
MAKSEKASDVRFTFRIDEKEWALFTSIIALERKNAIDVIRAYVRQYIEERKGVLMSAAAELEKTKV